MDEELKPEVEFASEVVTLAIDGTYDTNAVMNGLAIACAAMLVDLAVQEDGTLDHAKLDADTKHFKNTLLAAVGFAEKQIQSASIAADNDI